MHPFEKAGLGKAPFRCLGLEYQEIRYGERVVNVGGVECTTKPGGTCALCGQYIVNMFRIESADGQRFHVGSDCVLKTCDKHDDIVQQVNEELSKKRKAARQTATQRKWHKVHETMSKIDDPAFAAHLRSLPHPKIDGMTLLDWVQWMSKYAGLSGMERVCKVIEREMATVN